MLICHWLLLKLGKVQILHQFNLSPAHGCESWHANPFARGENSRPAPAATNDRTCMEFFRQLLQHLLLLESLSLIHSFLPSSAPSETVIGRMLRKDSEGESGDSNLPPKSLWPWANLFHSLCPLVCWLDSKDSNIFTCSHFYWFYKHLI